MAFRKFCDNCSNEITDQHKTFSLSITQVRDSEYDRYETWYAPGGGTEQVDRSLTHCCDGCAKAVVAALRQARTPVQPIEAEEGF